MHDTPECDDMIHRLACLLPALLAPHLAAGDLPAKYEVEKHRNLAYNPARDADPVRHKLDLYLPKGAKKFPVMTFVHGGAWRSGNKDLYAALGETFAKQGVGTAVINYRLSGADGKVKHPDHVHDVARAFAWVKANAPKYGGDPEKLYLSGHSAGGHLVALLATDEQYLKAEKCSTKDLKGVMALSGVYTITPQLPMLATAFGTDARACEAASPLTHVKADHPPFLIAYGAKDFPFLDMMAEQFGKKLTANKCDAKVLKLDRDHFSIIISAATSAADPLAKGMLEFMGIK
ncbi:MAG TPA: alpha/beta hydrolase [Gemmataceae bacterium]|jgi:acetyl esterase/lipase|nr:alpha/beta hydrolase [Gemmataceae bacterium]